MANWVLGHSKQWQYPGCQLQWCQQQSVLALWPIVGTRWECQFPIHDMYPTSKQCNSNSDPVPDQCTRHLVNEVPKYYSSVVCHVPRLACREVQSVLHCSQRFHAIVPRQQVLDSFINHIREGNLQVHPKICTISTNFCTKVNNFAFDSTTVPCARVIKSLGTLCTIAFCGKLF